MEGIEEELNNFLDESIIKGKTFNLNDYEIKERMYFGNFSKISLVENKNTKEKYTLKGYPNKRIYELYNEMEIINEKNTNEKVQNLQI